MPDQLIQIAQSLIAFRTTRDNSAAIDDCLNFIAAFFEKNAVVRRFQGDSPSLLMLPPGIKKPEILFVGHCDVVEAETKQFHPRIQGDKLYGRGAFDMKGPLAALIVAYQHDLERGNSRVGLLVTSDEEQGGFQGAGEFVHHRSLLPEIAIVPDGGGDTPFETASGGKGNCKLTITVQGKSAHSSRPWEGENAIFKATQILSLLKKKYPGAREKNTAATTIVPVEIMSEGHGHNVVARRSKILCNVRYTPNFDFSALRRYLDLPGVDIKIEKSAEPYDAHLHHPLAKKFLSTMAEVLHHPIQISRYPSTCDARFFAEHGIPVIVTRPKGEHAHGSGEWVSISGLAIWMRILDLYA